MFIVSNLQNNVLEAEVITMIDIVGPGSQIVVRQSFDQRSANRLVREPLWCVTVRGSLFEIILWPWKASFLVIVICSIMYLSAWFSIRQFLGLNCRSVQRDSKFYYTRNASPAISNSYWFDYRQITTFHTIGGTTLDCIIWSLVDIH